MTKYEKEIYNIVNNSYGHLTVDQIFERLKETYPGVVLATVYNNLNKLWEDQLIHKVSVEGMPDRYDRMEKHDHLVCRFCGSLTDIQLEDLTLSLEKQLGEAFLSYDLKVFYICALCRERLKKKR
ncbi:MAG: transcriptional repressor [Hungatella sp.]|nr:transcriptional repressor [Hungatella sp.]